MEKKLRVAISLLTAIGAFAFAGQAQAQTVINSLPYTINTPGDYVLGSNLTYNSATGAAITFNIGNVNLDFANHYISGLAAGTATQAIGLSSTERANITIKNGAIAGFFKGISFTGNGLSTSNNVGHIIENMRLPSNTSAGIEILNGINCRIENCQVNKTGGTTVFGANALTYGLYLNSCSIIVRNNQISTTTGVGTGEGFGIYCLNTSRTFVVGNQIDTSPNGLRMQPGLGKYQNNLTAAVSTPFTGGVDAGGNN
jgi:hypothetical protein